MKTISRFDFFRMNAEGKMHPADVGVGMPFPGERCWATRSSATFPARRRRRRSAAMIQLQVLALALQTLRKRFLAELEHAPRFFYDEEDVDPMTGETLSHCFPSL